MLWHYPESGASILYMAGRSLSPIYKTWEETFDFGYVFQSWGGKKNFATENY